MIRRNAESASCTSCQERCKEQGRQETGSVPGEDVIKSAKDARGGLDGFPLPEWPNWSVYGPRQESASDETFCGIDGKPMGRYTANWDTTQVWSPKGATGADSPLRFGWSSQPSCDYALGH